MFRLFGIVLGVLTLIAAILPAAATGTLIYQKSVGAAALCGALTLLLVAAAIWLIRGPQRKSWRDDPATDRQKSFADE